VNYQVYTNKIKILANTTVIYWHTISFLD